jgi:hypothetical protein
LDRLLQKWAVCRDPARLKDESDRGVNEIDIPGFKPNVGPVRQKMREKVHSSYVAIPPDHQK